MTSCKIPFIMVLQACCYKLTLWSCSLPLRFLARVSGNIMVTSWCCYELQQWPISNDIFIPLVILHFPFFWLFGSFLSLWSCITWSRVSSLHVATFHPHFWQVIVVAALWSFCNSWCFMWVSSPCHLAHAFVVILHNNKFVVLKITIVNDNERFNIFIFSTNYHCR
jgi:hypothetical protein